LSHLLVGSAVGAMAERVNLVITCGELKMSEVIRVERDEGQMELTSWTRHWEAEVRLFRSDPSFEKSPFSNKPSFLQG
jgi:hypothetical protein